MPAVEPSDFRPTAEQRRLYESNLLPRIERRTGRSGGRRYAAEGLIVATAATPEQAELAITDLRTRGIALLDGDGNRVEPPSSNGARFTYMRFDEGPREIPCLDCDEAGCEKCGGTGRKKVGRGA